MFFLSVPSKFPLGFEKLFTLVTLEEDPEVMEYGKIYVNSNSAFENFTGNKTWKVMKKVPRTTVLKIWIYGYGGIVAHSMTLCAAVCCPSEPRVTSVNTLLGSVC